MPQVTYLRYLRLRYGISLQELAKQANISAQQLSRLELRLVPCTPRQEEKLCHAVEGWIVCSRERTDAVEQEYFRYKGNLLRYMEECEHEL